uniref:S-acyltransferase n=1 Tax=Zea mays TaxID=4577 RepID=B6TAC2_MAIZE|nr:DHHC zinc finger domain containing protein [Zea mays]
MAEAEREQRPLPEVEQSVTSIPEDHEATCWGCGLRLVFASYSPIYKCGWCGAVTQSNSQTARKPDSIWFSHWRRLRDRLFVAVLVLFMLFVICGGVWAVYPVVFSVSKFCGVFHCTVAAVLAVCTVTSYCLASLKCAGAPTDIRWGSYPVVGKGDLENYTFCTYCNKPKPPRAHHCRSCKMCVVDMDHHCPFIGNCVGASNHQVFVVFLISVVISCSYVAGMTIYASYQIWPSIEFPDLASSSRHSMSSWKTVLEMITTVAGSAFFLSARGLVLVYLAFASSSVNAGIAVLLCQQLSYIYQGNTYLNRLSSAPNALQHGERGLQNIVRFFGCPYPVSRVVLRLRYSNAAKLQDDSGSKLL